MVGFGMKPGPRKEGHIEDNVVGKARQMVMP